MQIRAFYAVATAQNESANEFISIAHHVPRREDVSPIFLASGLTRGEALFRVILASIREAIENGATSIRILTCEKYIADGFNRHLDTWASKNWKKSKGSRLKDVGAWQTLYNLRSEVEIEIVHVSRECHSIQTAKEEALRLTKNSLPSAA